MDGDEDDVQLAEQIARLLRGRTIATAESCTAGRVAEVLASVEHAVDFLRGGLIAYQESTKRELLAVTAESVLSSEAAGQMAAGAADLLAADVTVATTGVAGGESQEGTPPGTVYIATSVDGIVRMSVHRFDGTPESVCEQARRQALAELVTSLDV